MATILPPAVTQFIDGNGDPLANGKVYFYVPNTLTPKDTWQNADESTLNSNPITLDSSGEAIIYGSGSYRQIVKDADGNLIWDQITTSTNSGGTIWGGTTGGSPNAQTIAASAFNGADGSILSVIAGYTNTNATTLTIGSASPIPIIRDGSTGPVALTGGEIVAENAIELIYDAGRGAFHLVQTTQSAFGATFGRLANAAAARTNLSLVPGTDVQPWQAPQNQATWNAGVGTVESTISPAKLDAATALKIANTIAAASLAKAWVNFNGTGTIAIGASYNVASITDNGPGDYTINFTTPFANAFYAAVGNCSPAGGNDTGGIVIASQAAGSVRIQLWTDDGGPPAGDATIVNLVVFGA